MFKILTQSFYVLFLLSSVSFAKGVDLGNGGDAIVCWNGDKTIRSVELLDLYEGREMREFKIDLGDSNLSVIEKIELALKRLEKFSPRRAERYRKRASEFFKEVLFRDDISLVDISDSDHVFFPDNCTVEQLVIRQKTVKHPEDKRFIVDNSLWKLMDNTNKAAMILHEIIYEEAVYVGHKNSKDTRYLNSLILSSKMKTLKIVDFAKVIQRIGFKTIVYQDRKYLAGSLEFYDNDQLKKGTLTETYVFEVDEEKYHLGGEVVFFKNGKIYSGINQKKFLVRRGKYRYPIEQQRTIAKRIGTYRYPEDKAATRVYFTPRGTLNLYRTVSRNSDLRDEMAYRSYNNFKLYGLKEKCALGLHKFKLVVYSKNKVTLYASSPLSRHLRDESFVYYSKRKPFVFCMAKGQTFEVFPRVHQNIDDNKSMEIELVDVFGSPDPENRMKYNLSGRWNLDASPAESGQTHYEVQIQKDGSVKRIKQN